MICINRYIVPHTYVESYIYSSCLSLLRLSCQVMADLGIRTLGNPFEALFQSAWIGLGRMRKKGWIHFVFFFSKVGDNNTSKGCYIYIIFAFIIIYNNSPILLLTKLLEDELELTAWFPFGSRNATGCHHPTTRRRTQ